MKAIGIFTSYAIVIVYSSLLNGWVLTKLWKWFIVPTFGLEPLKIAQAIGFAMVVTFLTVKLDTDEKREKQSTTQNLLINFFVVTGKCLIFLGVGSIVKFFL